MDKTQKLKNIILSRYGSIREFAKIANIPSTTLTSSLDRGIGGMAVDRIITICEILNIDVKTFEPLNNLSNNISNEETLLLQNYNRLNTLGKNKLMEYSKDLIETPKYLKGEDNITELITSTKEKPQSLEEIYITLAAHSDDLSDDEKNEADRRILEVLKKKKK